MKNRSLQPDDIFGAGVRESSLLCRGRHGVVAFSLLMGAAQAWAGAGNAGSGPVTGMEILRLFFGLGTVLALLLLAAWLFKRLAGSGLGKAGGRLRVVSSLNVGHRARILLVDIEGTRLLLGSGPQRVELIARVEGDKASADLEQNDDSFMKRLAQQLKTSK